jgi:tetratricopeptide (TPR) repeat protein
MEFLLVILASIAIAYGLLKMPAKIKILDRDRAASSTPEPPRESAVIEESRSPDPPSIRVDRFLEKTTANDLGSPSKDSCYEDWKNRGDRHLVCGAYPEALEAYDRALELQPKASYLWQQRGETLKRLRRYQEAISSYDRAIEVSMNPIGRYQAWNGKGSLLFALQRYEESIAAYHQALAICPNGIGSSHILGLEGMAWSKLKHYEKAGDCYRQAYHKAIEVSEQTRFHLNDWRVRSAEQI